jgi:hypothetical protein
MKKFFLIIAVAMFVISCERNNPVDATCDELSDMPILGFNETYYEHNYQEPCYNPLNAAEFVYVYFNGSTYKYELRIHNLQTGEDRKLHEAFFIFDPIWTVNGKIYFNDNSRKVYQIYQTGDDLSLVSSHDYRFVNYDPQNDILIYHRRVSNSLNENFIDFLTGDYFDLLLSKTFSELDTIGISNIIDWNQGEFAGFYLNKTSDLYSLVHYNIIQKTKTILHSWKFSDFTSAFGYASIYYLDKYQIAIIFNSKGIDLLNLTNGSLPRIKHGCKTVNYINPSFSSDGKTILSERIELVQVDPITIQERHRIVQLNIDGSGEKIILD